jgi:hypothetical protein
MDNIWRVQISCFLVSVRMRAGLEGFIVVKQKAGQRKTSSGVSKQVATARSASAAGKTLSNPKASKTASALAQRQVKSPAKSGKVSRKAIKKAVAEVSSARAG